MESSLTVIREIDPVTGTENFAISFPPDDPPDVYFDTQVWIGMSKSDEEVLKALKKRLGFRYRYSVTNYVELLSQLGRGPVPGWTNYFPIVRGAFRKISRLCEPPVLPSPEMEFLAEAGLAHCLSPAWIPDPIQTAVAVDLIAKAETLGDITGEGIQTVRSIRFPRWVVDPAHYLHLSEIDEKSMTEIMESLGQYAPGALTKENIKSLTPWFQKLAHFFLLIRPSSGRTKLSDLSQEEQNRFWSGFTSGPGRMFHTHTTLIAIKTINWAEKIDSNDLYDALQLLMLREGRLFITNDHNFFRHTKDSFVHGVVRWDGFKQWPEDKDDSRLKSRGAVR